MNGNFEIDKSAYPYAGVTIGSGVRVLYTPTQDQITGNLPRPVAAAVALRLNTLHHSRTPQSLTQLGVLLENIDELVRDEARSCHERATIDAIALNQILAR